MGTADFEGFFRSFPGLRSGRFKKNSPPTPGYNCIAWALGRTDRWWWPNENSYWPPGCLQRESIQAFVIAFATQQYEPCDNPRLEKSYEKLALYAKDFTPTHAAKQLKNGKWTSKLGKDMDIEHRLKDLEGPAYGQVLMFFRRRIKDAK